MTPVQLYNRGAVAAAAAGADRPGAKPGAAKAQKRGTQGNVKQIARHELLGKARQALYFVHGHFYTGMPPTHGGAGKNYR